MPKNLGAPQRTAIKRTRVSAPTRYLNSKGLLVGRVLDYGCGYGEDASEFGFEVYDPYFFPRMPRGKFDTIICNYVLNVVPENIQNWIVRDIERRLKPNGFAYITVRRDLTGNETTQRIVKINLPVLIENNGYCIYETWRR
jgi:ATP adenylyltransferase